MEKYRIPAFVYAPGFIQPQKMDKLVSQIDLMPTVLGLLNFDYQSKFFGQNVLLSTYKPRAFIATYQDLGYISNDTLTIISPVKKMKQYALVAEVHKEVEGKFEIHYTEKLLSKKNKHLENETIGYYEEAAGILKKHKYQKISK